MHNLSQRYGKLLSVGLSVICSVFLVAVIVSAATTIGANVATVNVTGTGILTISGAATIGGAATISGAATVSGLTTLGKATSSMLSAYSFYVGGTATTTINSAGTLAVAGNETIAGTLSVTGLATMGSVSSTALTAYDSLQIGRTATSTIYAGAAATSTLSSGLTVDEATTTSTLQLGHSTVFTAGANGKGGCIALAAASSTPNGTLNFLYLTVLPSIDGTRLELVTSTNASACSY